MTEAAKIRKVDARGGAADILAELREKLSPRGDVVSPRGKALTEEVFGQPLSPAEVVQAICDDVQKTSMLLVLFSCHWRSCLPHA